MSATKLWLLYAWGSYFILFEDAEWKIHISFQGVQKSNKLWSKSGNPMPLMFINNLCQFNCKLYIYPWIKVAVRY